MTRRNLLHTTAAASLAGSAAAAPAKPAVINMMKISFRNSMDNQRQRTTEFLQKGFVPAAKRAGIKSLGLFSSMIAPDTPFILVVSSYPSLAAFEEVSGKFAEDKEYMQAREALDNQPGVSYQRLESSLLRGFPTMPDIEVPPAPEGKGSRVFELRIYESNNTSTLARKVKMFDDGEIAIFRKYGLLPIFFGTTMVGRNMPNLTYMVAFDDLAAREKNWRAFGSSPEWQKLRSTPGLSDPEIVSNISNVLLTALPFSPIR
jgi:hypothetical protein